MAHAAVSPPSAADVWSDEMKDILRDIVCKVWRAPTRPTDVWLRLGNLFQNCPPPTLQVQSHRGLTALFLAAQCRQPLICSLLLARGANFDETFIKGDTAGGLFNLLCGWESDREEWDDEGACTRARTAEAEVMRVLIRGGVALDGQSKDGHTPLMFACCSGHVEIAEALLAAPGERLGWEKSGVVVMDGDESPLSMASWSGHFDVVKVLCRQEFRPNVLVVSANDGGLSLGHCARERGFDELAEFLEGFAWDNIG